MALGGGDNDLILLWFMAMADGHGTREQKERTCMHTTDYLSSFFMSQHEVDGKSYYTFEFVAKAPNFTRHALSTIAIGNGINHIQSSVSPNGRKMYG